MTMFLTRTPGFDFGACPFAGALAGAKPDTMTTTRELPIEHCEEYDAAAEWCAARGYKGEAGDPLPDNMAANGALRWIQADPEAFAQRVREFAYAKSMTTTHHSPGPWLVGREYSNAQDEIEDAEGRTLAVVWTRTPTVPAATARPCWKDDAKGKANARLIAAAPELLDALHKISANAAESAEWVRRVADEAIAKAIQQSA